MFRTKKDVDHHVQDIFRKLKDDNEKTTRCFKIAELYHNVGDNDSARRYLSRYIDRYKESKAYKLLGQILESLGQKEDALIQYKHAFELNGKHEELIVKVCTLMADPEVEIDVNHAKHWAERAENLTPCPKVVFQLKEKILSIERPSNSEEDLENLILSELAVRPSDVQLRIKLLNHYMEINKFEKAYKHATELEVSSIFRDSLPWNKVLCELFTKCKNNKQQNWSFWISYVGSLERCAALTLKELGSLVKNNIEAIQAVHNLDQCLFEFKAQSFSSYPALTESVFLHMWGQLHLHMACLLIQNAKREQGSWNEAARLSAPLFLHAVHIKPFDTSASWVTHLDHALKKQLQVWYREGSYRCSQAGHILYDLSEGNQNKLIDSIEKFCTGSWRERLYQRIFVSQIHQKMRSSYFTNNNAENTPCRLVSFNELKRYDKIAEEVWPHSLHHQIWPAVAICNLSVTQMSKDVGLQPNLTSHLFPDLSFSVYNVNQTSSVTLCRLDIDAFLNAAVICANAVLKKQRYDNLSKHDKLRTVPADLSNPLCTEEQEKWWSAAYKMYCKESLNHAGDIRQNLQRGLEVVRCIGNHGLHPVILVHLARIFQYRAKRLKEKNSESGDILALETRSELYWSAAIPLLERIQNNQSIRSSGCKLFDYTGKDMNNMELTQAIEQGKLLLAQKLVKDKLYEQAIEALQVLKSPEASFEQGKIYKKMADETLSSLPKENVTSEMRSQHIIILSKARNCFYLTLDRLRSPDTDPKHPLNFELCTYITSVENELKRIDPDIVYNDRHRNDCDNFSEESYSSAHSDDHPVASHSFPAFNSSCLTTPLRSTRRNLRQSTPRTYNHDMDTSRNRIEARPSPERLDAQIRQLVISIESLKEQNREHNRAVMAKLEEIMKSNYSKENRKLSSEPSVPNHNLEGDYYGLYGENNEEYTRNYGSYNASIPANVNHASLAQNLFSQRQQPYTHLMYPQAGAVTALQSYYQGGPLAFPDSTSVGAQHLTAGLYPAYPMSPMYRPGLEQPMASMQQMTDSSIQQGLFGQRLSSGIHDYQQLTPQLPLGNAGLGGQAKIDPKISFPTTVESSVSKSSLSTAASSGSRLFEPPVNVVITSSDTLPTTVSAVQSTLSVTIPAQHRLGSLPMTESLTPEQNAPHGYQIPMPYQATLPTQSTLTSLSTSLTSSPGLKSLVTANQNTSNLSETRHSCSSDNTEVEHDPIPDFKPIIPLPDEVPVTTGEENEETLFSGRAKLYRFAEKEWKERGIGNIKLLKNDEGKVRLLMRREQVLKICANHMLREDMELSPMPNNDKAYIWVANDFADEELKLEKLCVKFKTAEEAAAFRDHFNKAKQNLPVPAKSNECTTSLPEKSEKTKLTEEKKVVSIVSNPASTFSFKPSTVVDSDNTKKKSEETKTASPFASFSFGQSFGSSSFGTTKDQTSNDKPSSQTAPFQGLKTTTTTDATQKPLSELFKPAPGSWECQDCYTRNDKSSDACKACQGPSPTATCKPVTQPAPSKNKPVFSFGIPQVNATPASQSAYEKSKPAVGSWECKQCYVINAQSKQYCDACDGPKDDTIPPKPKVGVIFSTLSDSKQTFTFGIPQTNATPSKDSKDTSSSSLFSNGNTTSLTSTFGTPSRSDTGFIFGTQPPETKTSGEKDSFAFGSPGKSFQFQFQVKSPPNKTLDQRETSDDDIVEESEDVYFTPVVPLPDKVDVKTGEENEEVLFSHRAKLYKFDGTEKAWKERGLGDIKLLKHVETKKLRLVMRRDQVLKLCLNHVVNASLEITSKDDKTWMWSAADFSDGEVEYMQFACRFKTPSIADEFKKSVEAACESESSQPTPENSFTESNIDKDSKESSPEIQVVYEINVTPDQKTAANKLKLPENFYSYLSKPDCSGCIGCKEPEVPLFKTDFKDSSKSSPVVVSSISATPASIFSFSASTTNNMFGGKHTPAASNLFNFGGTPATTKTTTSTLTFGSSISSPSFNTLVTPSTGQKLFGSNATSESNDKAVKEPDTADKNGKTQTSIFKVDDSLSFSALAAKSSEKPVIDNSVENSNKTQGNMFKTDDSLSFSALAVKTGDQQAGFKPDPNFTFAGAGASVFGSKATKPVDKNESVGNDSKKDVSTEEANETVEENDPYFEPIIPLPDAIEVRTGEEDEEKVFCQRAKLYRYDQNTREWKERGTGEMKLLYHSSHGSYRLLLRREQVYKVVCNLLLTPDIEFLALNSSDRAWMWAGMNYADPENPAIEQLAVRFKSQQLAQQFKEAIDSAQQELASVLEQQS